MSNNTGCNNNAECFQTSNVAASRPRGADIILIDVMDAYGSFTPVAMCSGVCERAGEPLVSEPIVQSSTKLELCANNHDWASSAHRSWWRAVAPTTVGSNTTVTTPRRAPGAY